MFYKNMADWGLHSGKFLHILVSFEKENIYPHYYKRIFAPKKETHLTFFKKDIFITAFKKNDLLIIKLINWCNNLISKFNSINQLI